MPDTARLRKDDLPLEVWAAEALCSEMQSTVFESVATIGAALGACSHCPVQRECLTWALDTAQTIGTWGNKTARQRRHLTAEDVQYWPPALLPTVVITAGPVPGGPARVESSILARSARPPVTAPSTAAAVKRDQVMGSGSGKPERKPPSNCDARCTETGTMASVRHYTRGELPCDESREAVARYRKQQKAKKTEERKAVAARWASPAVSPAPVQKPKVRVCWLVPNETTPPGVSYEYSYRTEDDEQDVVISARIAEIRASQGKSIRRRTVSDWQDVGGGES